MDNRPTATAIIDRKGTFLGPVDRYMGLTVNDSIDTIKYPKLTYERLKELLKCTIEVCGDKENSKYSSHYDEFIEELMKEIGMTEEEFDELFEEE